MYPGLIDTQGIEVATQATLGSEEQGALGVLSRAADQGMVVERLPLLGLFAVLVSPPSTWTFSPLLPLSQAENM